MAIHQVANIHFQVLLTGLYPRPLLSIICVFTTGLDRRDKSGSIKIEEKSCQKTHPMGSTKVLVLFASLCYVVWGKHRKGVIFTTGLLPNPNLACSKQQGNLLSLVLHEPPIVSAELDNLESKFCLSNHPRHVNSVQGEHAEEFWMCLSSHSS